MVTLSGFLKTDVSPSTVLRWLSSHSSTGLPTDRPFRRPVFLVGLSQAPEGGLGAPAGVHEGLHSDFRIRELCGETTHVGAMESRVKDSEFSQIRLISEVGGRGFVKCWWISCVVERMHLYLLHSVCASMTHPKGVRGSFGPSEALR